MTYRNKTQEITDKAHMASELRLLGFSEYGIGKILQLDSTQIEEIIKKYQTALDLMGDDEE